MDKLFFLLGYIFSLFQEIFVHINFYPALPSCILHRPIVSASLRCILHNTLYPAPPRCIMPRPRCIMHIPVAFWTSPLHPSPPRCFLHLSVASCTAPLHPAAPRFILTGVVLQYVAVINHLRGSVAEEGAVLCLEGNAFMITLQPLLIS